MPSKHPITPSLKNDILLAMGPEAKKLTHSGLDLGEDKALAGQKNLDWLPVAESQHPRWPSVNHAPGVREPIAILLDTVVIGILSRRRAKMLKSGCLSENVGEVEGHSGYDKTPLTIAKETLLPMKLCFRSNCEFKNGVAGEKQ